MGSLHQYLMLLGLLFASSKASAALDCRHTREGAEDASLENFLNRHEFKHAAAEIRSQIADACKEAGKAPSDLTEVITLIEAHRRSQFGIRSIRGPVLDVRTANDTTEIVLSFKDKSQLQILITYLRRPGRHDVLE